MRHLSTPCGLKSNSGFTQTYSRSTSMVVPPFLLRRPTVSGGKRRDTQQTQAEPRPRDGTTAHDVNRLLLTILKSGEIVPTPLRTSRPALEPQALSAPETPTRATIRRVSYVWPPPGPQKREPLLEHVSTHTQKGTFNGIHHSGRADDVITLA